MTLFSQVIICSRYNNFHRNSKFPGDRWKTHMFHGKN